MTGENFETVTVEEISTVEVCDSCGTDLSDIEPSAREQRVQLDIKYTVKKLTLYLQIAQFLNRRYVPNFRYNRGQIRERL